MTSFEKTPFIQMETQKEDTKYYREENASENIGTLSPISRISPHPGAKKPVPGGALFSAPRLPSLAAAPLLSLGRPRTAEWTSCGGTMRLRDVGWRSGEPMFRGEYQKKTEL